VVVGDILLPLPLFPANFRRGAVSTVAGISCVALAGKKLLNVS